jgi:membrane-associated protease RseP (regulator of RpoE activity)
MTPGPQENIILDGALLGKLRVGIEDIFQVDRIETPRQAPQGTILFIGDLLMRDSEAAYELIAQRWLAHDYTPLLRRRDGQIAVIAQPGIVTPKPSNPWINLGWAITTLFSVLLTGAYAAYAARFPSCPQTSAEQWAELVRAFPKTLSDWASGFPMMLTIMAILLAHEFGHYFTARYHKVAVTLPYFIPLPFISPMGTLGAFIQLRSPFKTKKQLFDIGIAGPLGGLVVAIPLIIWGVANSPVQEVVRRELCPSSLEGNSIFYLTLKYFIHGQLLPSFDQYSNLSFWHEFLLLLAGAIPPGGGVDIFLASPAFAAWFGLFVTAMNLLPVGQLDGGHVVYCLLGEKARWLGLTLVSIMFVLGIFWWSGWLLWALLVFFVIGPGHPPPLNDLPSLGWPRTLLAYLMIFIFIILFMPNPLQLL